MTRPKRPTLEEAVTEPNKREVEIAKAWLAGTDERSLDEMLAGLLAAYRAELLAPFEELATKSVFVTSLAIREAIRRAKEGT